MGLGNTGVTLDLENSTVRILRESELQEMQKVGPLGRCHCSPAS